ncbi:hypothetical protein ACFWB2_39975 [Streptomyces virginiae]|uniref:preATP grasp domain-containing protein n=1 Tax=Streptomyces virginiae TaxID=1961 RepID=UPI003694EF53
MGLPSDAALVHLGNFDVESDWARGEIGMLPPRADSPDPLASRMAELALLLGNENDYVVLQTQPDHDYISYLRELRLSVPHILTVDDPEFKGNLATAALASPRLTAQLADLARAGAHLVPHGVSRDVEALARRAGLPFAAAPSARCKQVNSKIYGRRLADALRLQQPAGSACESIDELQAAVAEARRLLDRGASVVVKDAFGVSGRGLIVVDTHRHLDRVARLITARAGDHTRVGIIIEEWVTRHADLHYHATIGRDGGVSLDCVLETILSDHGVPMGNRAPTAITRVHHAELARCAAVVGARLYSDGFFGTVGVDAMVGPAGLYPLVEINARHTLCTYQIQLRERFLADQGTSAARYYPLRATRFAELRERMGDLMFDRRRGTGLLVTGCMAGRLHGLIFAEDEAEAGELDDEISQALAGGAAHGF